MDIFKIAKEMRLLLYKCDEESCLKKEIENIIGQYNLDYTVETMENFKHIIIDVVGLVQFVRSKERPLRIYEIICIDSPLNQGPTQKFNKEKIKWEVQKRK